MNDTTHEAPDDLVKRLHSLHKQATVERSHFYVGSCAKDAMHRIEELEAKKYHDAWLEVEIAELEAKLAKAEAKLADLERWRAAAFIAHNNLDLDIEADPQALAELKGQDNEL